VDVMKLDKRVIGSLLLILASVLLAYIAHRSGLTWSQKDPPPALERETQTSEPGHVINRETLPKPKGPGRNWTLSELASLTEEVSSGRDFENGRLTYAAAGCIVCHRFDGAGGTTGPDLTIIIERFEYQELVETIVQPSKVIPDSYRWSNIVTTDGKVITGRVIRNPNGSLTVLVDARDPTKVVQISRDEIAEIIPLKISLMPSGLLTPLNKEEILDLMAYLMSQGDPADPRFAKSL
jgi:putative heme-binding domain-containing protein